MKEKTIKELIYKLLEEYKSPSYVSFLLTRAASEIDSMTLDGEEWRPVSGYEGLYSVSNKGRVKSLSRTVSKSTSFRHETADKIMRSSKLRSGYLFVHLTKDGKTKMFPIHRLVAIAFIPNKENLPFVNHKDAQPLINNRADNLEWCTQLYNVNYGDCRKKMSLRASLLRGKGVYHIENGTVQRYDSLREASEKTGIKKDTLKHYCYHNKKGWNYSK